MGGIMTTILERTQTSAPYDAPTRELTLGQTLDNTVALYPDNPAVVMVDREFRRTWREFSDDVDLIARGLMALGVEKGGKVAIWATNVPHWVELMFATAKIGAVLITVNTGYKTAEIEYLLEPVRDGELCSSSTASAIRTTWTPSTSWCRSCANSRAATCARRASPSSSAWSSSARKSIAACIPCTR